MFYASLTANRPTWIKDHKVKILVQMGGEKESGLPDVPFLTDLVSKPEDKQLVQQASAPMAIGRPYALPPGVPAERVAALRNALWAVFQDPEFVAEAPRCR